VFFLKDSFRVELPARNRYAIALLAGKGMEKNLFIISLTLPERHQVD
jgi:hypothetical protein